MMAATALALFLRYTTFIEPPPLPSSSTSSGKGTTAATATGAAARDNDHILPCLIRVLSSPEERSALRNEPKLRHRLLAALGESVFYISAQLEEGGASTDTDTGTGTADSVTGDAGPGGGGGSGSGSKWFVPPAAISVLVACLKDDTDEVVRHYAAKVSQSASQGS